MGVVYEAEDVRLGRHVALKFIVSKALDRPDRVVRFEREARAASVLNHPNICTIHDVGEAEGHHFIAMELLEGKNLDVLLKHGALPVKQLLEIATQIAEGLTAAHSRNVIHRDIKPANIFVTSAGFAKIMDFGLAKVLQAAESLTGAESDATVTSGLTTPGITVGTVAFMSPEQSRGEEVDARSDLFSFGSLLYNLAVGVPPFRGPTAAVIFSQILERNPIPPLDLDPTLPPKLQDIILKALEKDREERYQSAREMAIDLRRLLREVDGGAMPSVSGTVSATSATGTASMPRITPAVPALRPPSRRKYWVASMGIVAALLAGFVLWKIQSARTGPAAPAAHREVRSLAVLPLDNLTSDPAQEYFADGMTDELIARLSKISALRVISRTSAMRYKGSKKSLPEIAKELQVDAVVEGSVLRAGDRVRINARLSDATEKQMWAESYDRDLRDILALQSDVASAIVREVKVKVAPEESSQLAVRDAVDPEAYELYLQGRVSFSRFTPESLARAAEYFNLAIAKDPGLAIAYAGLADSYIQLAGRVRPPREVMPKARAAIERALALDPNLAEAYASLAQVKLFYEFDWPGAGLQYRRAVEHNPSSTYVHQANGLFLAAGGKSAESLAEADRIRALDPVSSSVGCLRVRLLYYAHRYDDAIGEYQKTVAADPTVAGFCTFAIFAYQKEGRLTEAISAAQRASEASPNEVLPKAALTRSYGVMGNHAAAEKAMAAMKELAKKRFISEHDFALAYSGWNRGESLRWFEKAYEGRAGLLVYANVDAVWDDLRSEPRFQEILRRIGIPR
jgi:serine/threonine protein kinase/TolB-like protein/tetratricopeptide (TPR) repeat protein